VAQRLLGGDARQQRVAVLERLGEVFEAELDDGALPEGLKRLSVFGELLVQRGGWLEVDGPFGERVPEPRGDGDERGRAGAQQVHEPRGLAEQRRLEWQRVNGLFERGRAAF